MDRLAKFTRFKLMDLLQDLGFNLNIDNVNQLTDQRWLGVEEYWSITQSYEGWNAQIIWDHHDGAIELNCVQHKYLIGAVKRCLFEYLWERKYWKEQPIETSILQCNGSCALNDGTGCAGPDNCGPRDWK